MRRVQRQSAKQQRRQIRISLRTLWKSTGPTSTLTGGPNNEKDDDSGKEATYLIDKNAQCPPVHSRALSVAVDHLHKSNRFHERMHQAQKGVGDDDEKRYVSTPVKMVKSYHATRIPE